MLIELQYFIFAILDLLQQINCEIPILPRIKDKLTVKLP